MGFMKPFSFVISIHISFLLIISAAKYSASAFNFTAYLERYGYLKYARTNVAAINDDDVVDDDETPIIKSAIKTFQENFHIKPTGILDSETLTAMKTPRCGVPDIINGVNYMQARARNYSSKFATYPGSPKWSKTTLSYSLANTFPEAGKFPLELAFTQWKVNSKLSFVVFDEGPSPSDITLGFYRREHGDGDPFDGPGGVLAHARPPEEHGFVHFDADETWSYENENGTPSEMMDFETVALHEIGHIIGLEHSTVQSAIMFPYMNYGKLKTLDDDDIKGIRYLYGN